MKNQVRLPKIALVVLLALMSQFSYAQKSGSSEQVKQVEEIEAPQWMVDLFKSIDELDFSESSGFQIMADDIQMNFINQQLRGIDNVKAFFNKLDGGMVTKHYITTVLKIGDDCFIMKGTASLKEKGASDDTTMSVDPLMNLLWLNEDGKVARYIVDVAPSISSQAGL